MTISLNYLKEINSILKDIERELPLYKSEPVIYLNYVNLRKDNISTIEYVSTVVNNIFKNTIKEGKTVDITISINLHNNIMNLIKDLKDFVKFVRNFTNDD